MNEGFRLFPERASTIASEVDAITLSMLGLCGLVALGILALMVYFIIRYHHTSKAERVFSRKSQHRIEYAWIILPFLLFVGIFTWGARVYFELHLPPPDSTEIYVVGKQWMWKFQHPNGVRELDELHVPIGRPIKLVMASQDVIHSVYVPAFRIKQDVVPGRYTYTWFQATRPGTYHLFCAEYCGNSHAEMRGRIIAMNPEDYEKWLTASGKGDQQAQGPALLSMASRGRELFTKLGCISCHEQPSAVRAPDLHGVYMSRVGLRTGETVTADEGYIRESILNPPAKIVMGFEAIMPSFQGQVSEEGLQDLVAYVKSLKIGEKPRGE